VPEGIFTKPRFDSSSENQPLHLAKKSCGKQEPSFFGSGAFLKHALWLGWKYEKTFKKLRVAPKLFQSFSCKLLE
jgi:hypothetical protein